jgi:hypothetical protein
MTPIAIRTSKSRPIEPHPFSLWQRSHNHPLKSRRC